MIRPVALIALCGLAVGAPVALAAQAVARPAPAGAQEVVRARVARLLRERVGLSDAQLQQLAPLSRAFEARRQALFRDERGVRQALRRELGATSPDQARVATYIDQLFTFQRRRIDIAAEEQRELAAFMTPAQRARYLALQETLRRRADEMRRRRGNGLPRGGRRGGPPGPRQL